MPPPKPHPVLLLAAACGSGLLCLATGAGEGGAGSCDFSVARGGALYSFSLASRTPAHRHGVLSEDGFYKVAVNDSVLWFQLCDQMIFNFDPPVCLDCEVCGGPLRCGTQCSALVSNNIGGYDVCTTIGRVSTSHISLIDESNPRKGVVVKMFSSKCSISVFILCDTTVAQVSDKFILSGSCDYATTLRHPSGCATSVSASGNGWGWLGILFIIFLCLLGGYILIGAIYRYYFLRIHSVEAIPNLEVWISLPQRIKEQLLQQEDVTVDEFYAQLSTVWRQIDSLGSDVCRTCQCCQRQQSHLELRRIYDFLTCLRNLATRRIWLKM